MNPSNLSEYKILRRIGEGYSALLDLAQTPNGDLIVVKTLRSEWGNDATKIASLRDEGALLMALTHPGVRVCHRLLDSPPAQVLAYIKGGSLADCTERLHTRGRQLEPAAMLWIVGRLVDALAYLHAQGVWHLDLIPQNIMLTDHGHPVLIDFDNAWWPKRRAVLRRGPYKHLQSFTPPEFESSQPLGPHTDSYQLGALMTYLSAGRLGNAGQCQGAQECPRELAELITTLTHPDPQARPRCDAGLAQLLLSWSTGMATQSQAFREKMSDPKDLQRTRIDPSIISW